MIFIPLLHLYFFLHSCLDIPRGTIYTNLVNGKSIKSRFQNMFAFSHTYSKGEMFPVVEWWYLHFEHVPLWICYPAHQYPGFPPFKHTIRWCFPACLNGSLMWPCDLLDVAVRSRCGAEVTCHFCITALRSQCAVHSVLPCTITANDSIPDGWASVSLHPSEEDKAQWA